MTVYVKGTDTLIKGTLDTIIGIALISDIEPDGAPVYIGETDVLWDSQESKTRDGETVWISEDGEEYLTSQIERREDGDTVEAFDSWSSRAVYHWGQDAHRAADRMGISELLGLGGALGDTAPDIAALVEFPAGFMTLDPDGRYWTPCDNQQCESRDFSEVARFLWDNHARHEIAAV